MGKKDDEKNGARPSHTGSTAAEDEELSLFINGLWARSETIERLELWQLIKGVRGEMIFHEDFPAGKKLDIEQANRLANEIIAAAQHDCDCGGKEASFQLAITDRNRRSSQLTRRVGPLHPKRALALKALRQIEAEVDADNEENLSLQVLDIRRIKEANDHIRWEKSRNDRIVEGMLLLQDNIIKTQQVTIDRLSDRLVQGVEKTQDALDRGAIRDSIAEEKRFNLGMKKELVRTARNLLPGFMGGSGGSGGNGGGDDPQPNTPAPSNGHAHTNGVAKKDYGKTPERVLVTSFLNDVEEDGLGVTLFGDFEERNGQIVQVREGIFSETQLKILLGVRAGHLPVSKLDELIPDWGHENAVSLEQIGKAGDAGLTDGVAMALLEVVNLRKQARAAAEAAKTPAPPPNDSPAL